MSLPKSPYAVDWDSHLSQHDLKYEFAPEVWEDGLLVGNGDLGAVVYCPNHVEWLLNKCDIWDDRPNTYPRFSHSDVIAELKQDKDPRKTLVDWPRSRHPRSVKPAATLRLRHPLIGSFGERWEGWERRLHFTLQSPEVKVESAASCYQTHLETFVPANKNVLALRYTDVPRVRQAGRVQLELARSADPHLGTPAFGCDEACGWIDYQFSTGFRYAVVLKVKPLRRRHRYQDEQRWVRPKHLQEPRAPEFSADAAGVYVKITGDFEAYVSVVTSHEARNPMIAAKKNVTTTARRGVARLRQPHRKWWNGFWSRSFLDLDNDFLEQAWYLSLYQLAACSRGRDCPGLAGLFFGDRPESKYRQPWGGNYTIDVNLTAQELPIFASNHLELGKPFFDTFHRMLPALRRHTRKYFGMDGVYYPLTLFPSGATDVETFDNYQQCAGPYLALWFWWGYRYSMDRDFLEHRAYPVHKAVADFFTAYMTPTDNGGLKLWPSIAPEMGPFGTNPTLTLCLLKATLKHAIRGAEILDRDPERRQRWAGVLARFPDYPEQDGVWLESADLPPDSYVSQFGGLYPVWPAGEMGLGSTKQEYAKALRTYRSGLQRQAWGAAGDARGVYSAGGISWAWYCRALAAARLGLSHQIERLLVTDGLKLFLKPNGTFSCYSSALTDPEQMRQALVRVEDKRLWDGSDSRMPCTEPYLVYSAGWGRSIGRKERAYPLLEGAGGYVGIINEMLLQSYDGLIRVFPCTPRSWNVRFGQFRCEGAFLVSSQIRQGKVAFVHIESLAGERARVVNPWPGSSRKVQLIVHVSGRRRRALLTGDVLEFDTQRGGTYRLQPQGARRQQAEKIAGRPGTSARSLRLPDGYRLWLGKPSRSEYYRDDLPV